MRIWRREAPIVRSVANSRIRCAIVIESEFAITNEPTKSAIPPNASRKPRRKRDELVRLGRVLLRLLEARHRLRVRREDRADLLEELLRRDPGFAATAISSRRPTFSNSFCAVGRSSRRGVAPPIERFGAELDDPRDAEPLDRAFDLHADLVADREVLLLRDARVDHDLVGPGPLALDEAERVERRVAVGDREAEVRRAAEDDRLAVLPDQRRRVAVDPPSACPTPWSPRTSPRSDSSSVGSVTPLPSLRSKADLPVTTTFEPSRRP